ncbi:hypothetical protein OIV83_000950 [Microbotryomycetes sp. JL201]|nr:hypothetical protein OIV83_000950 [Microbotryomycetes sp. JL201]
MPPVLSGSPSIDGQRQEKRAKRYRSSPPKSVQERAMRVRSQRFFCVERNKIGPTSEQFSVLGSTGNVYTATIDQMPKCTCPDGIKGNTCKHIIFIMLRVLQVPHASGVWYQSALLSTELKQIFNEAPAAPQSVMDHRLSTAYRVATGKESASAEPGSLKASIQKRLPGEGDSCPICYEDLEPGSEKGLVFCLSIGGCGNGLHRECFQTWCKSSASGTRPRCIMCRQFWDECDPAVGNVGTACLQEGYVNLAHVSGQDRERDVSTYYSGPRRRGQQRPYWDSFGY